MIKRILLTCILLVWLLPAFSQSGTDTLQVKEIPDCETTAFNSANLIMYFYDIQDFDSASLILDNWQEICGLTEPILRTRILLAIRTNTFAETIYDSTVVYYVLNYMFRMDTTTNIDLFYNYPDYFGNIPIREQYDFFTQSVADELLQFDFSNPLELLFSRFYANLLTDPIKEIQLDTLYAGTAIRQYYFNDVNKLKRLPDYHLSFNTGTWVPFGNASLLGIHPFLGMQVGMRLQKMTYNVAFSLRFLQSQNEYEILRNGSVDTSRYFLSGYIGIDVEREMMVFGKNEFDLLAGVGYDGIETINVNTEDDDPNNDKGQSISSLNINFGIGYRRFLPNKSYISIQGKYNLLNYYNPGGTNFSGDCLTITLCYGAFFNEKKTYGLNELKYIGPTR